MQCKFFKNANFPCQNDNLGGNSNYYRKYCTVCNATTFSCDGIAPSNQWCKSETCMSYNCDGSSIGESACTSVGSYSSTSKICQSNWVNPGYRCQVKYCNGAGACSPLWSNYNEGQLCKNLESNKCREYRCDSGSCDEFERINYCSTVGHTDCRLGCDTSSWLCEYKDSSHPCTIDTDCGPIIGTCNSSTGACETNQQCCPTGTICLESEECCIDGLCAEEGLCGGTGS